MSAWILHTLLLHSTFKRFHELKRRCIKSCSTCKFSCSTNFQPALSIGLKSLHNFIQKIKPGRRCLWWNQISSLLSLASCEYKVNNQNRSTVSYLNISHSLPKKPWSMYKGGSELRRSNSSEKFNWKPNLDVRRKTNDVRKVIQNLFSINGGFSAKTFLPLLNRV